MNDMDEKICEYCPSFQGRGNYCKMGLDIRKGDMRTCDSYGRTDQKEYLIKNGCWDSIKKYWMEYYNQDYEMALKALTSKDAEIKKLTSNIDEVFDKIEERMYHQIDIASSIYKALDRKTVKTSGAISSIDSLIEIHKEILSTLKQELKDGE